MDILHFFLINCFRKKRITKKRLRAFTEALIQALISRNDAGQYDTLISDLSAVYILFYGKVSGELTDLTIQKAKTTILNLIISQFQQKAHRDYMVIGSKYYKDTPEFKEFYPLGLSEFNHIGKTNFELTIDRFIAAVTTYQGGVITAQMLTDYTAMKTNFLSAYAVQEDKMQDVKKFKSEGDLVRVDLEDQLYYTLFKLGTIYYKTPEVIRDYFKTELLFPHNQNPQDETTEDFSVVLAALETKNSGLTNIVGKTARFINLTDAKVLIWTVPNLDHLDPSATALTLDADDEVEVLLSELGASDFPFLILRNLSDELEAEVVIEWVE